MPRVASPTRTLPSSSRPAVSTRVVPPWWARWPLPALAGWSLAWALYRLLTELGGPSTLAGALACTLGAGLALRQDRPWRRLIVAGGFPLSALLSGWLGPTSLVQASLWLLPIAALMLLYPVRAWQDAPIFPTPAEALAELPRRVSLPAGARLLDAGCGLGHGLAALRRAYPDARLSGVEWSAPIALLAALRCPWARVRRGDMWAGDWSDQDLVYIFQRPESMARAWAKACAEMPAGSWLVSLEFPVPDQRADERLAPADGKPVWLYRVPKRASLHT